MPTFRHGDATIYCEEFGRGFPILTKLLPTCELVREWKTEPALTSARKQVADFLAKHTPRGS